MFLFARVPDDYQRLRPEAFARFVLGFSMPIARPAVADGVAKGTAPNIAFSVRPAATGATWLLMVVAVIVWNPGIGFFAYGSIVGYKYAFCKEVGGINFAGFAGAGQIGAERQRQSSTMGGGGWRHRVGGKGVPARGSVSNLGGAIFRLSDKSRNLVASDRLRLSPERRIHT